jgi:hypothetical protein
VQFQPTATQQRDDARMDEAIAARERFDALDALLAHRERRIREEWRSLHQERQAALCARQAAARVAGCPHIAGMSELPPAA